MDELKGLKALVTGGASGIGLAIDATFAAEGAVVIVLDLVSERPDVLPAEIGYVTASITDDTAVRTAVDAALETLGGLDILVNNAGIGAQGTVEDAPDEEWHRVLDVNVVGTARVSRAVWPALRASTHAAVVNTCSIAATAGLPQRAVYSASKGAVAALTRAMAADGMPDGIRVNAVNPGTADTPWVSHPRARGRRPVPRSRSTAEWPASGCAPAHDRCRCPRAPVGPGSAAAAVDRAVPRLATVLPAARPGKRAGRPRPGRRPGRPGRRHHRRDA
jgi:NAD(P)-dependent dehydrogenase (short-subunit alcohol dehydrogenase family)